LRNTTRTFIVGCIIAAGVAIPSAASAAPLIAEDGSVVSQAYYSDPTHVAEYERRLHKRGACRIATAMFARGNTSARVQHTMATCLRTP
jgi:hypothetical protein